jgi:hypothetical protein
MNTTASIISKASIVPAGATTAAAQRQQRDDRNGCDIRAPARRRGGKHGPFLFEPIGGARSDGLVAIAQHETVETLGAGETKMPRAGRILLDQAQYSSRRGAARSDHQRELVLDCERQHAGGGRFDQAFVIERAACARRIVERLEDHAEALAQCAQIRFLAQGPVAISTRSAPTPSAAALSSAASITSRASSERTQSISGQVPARPASLAANSSVQGSIEGLADSPNETPERPLAAPARTATPMPHPAGVILRRNISRNTTITRVRL